MQILDYCDFLIDTIVRNGPKKLDHKGSTSFQKKKSKLVHPAKSSEITNIKKTFELKTFVSYRKSVKKTGQARIPLAHRGFREKLELFLKSRISLALSSVTSLELTALISNFALFFMIFRI